MTVVATMKRARENRLRRTADGQGNVARRDKTQASPSASDCLGHRAAWRAGFMRANLTMWPDGRTCYDSWNRPMVRRP
jgi:hypothetical protein